MKAANLVVKALSDFGVRYVAGVIGSSIEDIVDSLYGHPQLRYISVRHEQVAASMCDGYAKVARRPMACLGHAGPGACNLILGVASAYRDATPMLVITGNTGSSRIGRDAWHELDVGALFRPVTKWTTRVTRVSALQPTLTAALSLSMAGKPGPVHVDIPQDIVASDITESFQSIDDIAKSFENEPPGVSDEALGQVLALLASTEKAVIFAGGGAHWSGASKSLRDLSRLLSLPVVTSETARGVLPDDDPLCLGVCGLYGNPGSNKALKDAELVLAIGCRFSEQTTLGWTLLPARAKIVQVNIDAREIGQQYPVMIGIAADAQVFLSALMRQLAAQSDLSAASQARKDWVATLQPLRASERQAFFEKAIETEPLKPQTVVREIIAVAGRDAVFSVGQGNLTASCMRVPVYEPGRFLQSTGLGAMGFAFPAALGAKLAAPERTVFCLVGDGDFGMVMQDLDTAAREKLNVVVAVFNNSGYGVNRLGQMARKRPSFGVDFLNPDFAALARMYGLAGYTVRTVAELRSALLQCATASGTTLLDVFIDPLERVGVNPKSVGLYT